MVLSSKLLTRVITLVVVILLIWAGLNDLNMSFKQFRGLSFTFISISLVASVILLVVSQISYKKYVSFPHVFLAGTLFVTSLVSYIELTLLNPNTGIFALSTCLLPLSLIVISFTKKFKITPMISAFMSLLIVIYGIQVFSVQFNKNFLGINHGYNSWLTVFSCLLYGIAYYRLRFSNTGTDDSVLNFSGGISILLFVATLIPLVLLEKTDLLSLVYKGLFSLITLGFLAAQIQYNFISPYKKYVVQFEKVESSRNLLRNIIDHVPMGVFWKNRNSIFLGGNKIFLKDIGFNNESEIVGKNEFEIHPDKAANFIDKDQQVMNSRIADIDFEELCDIEGRKPFWMRSSKVPLFDNNDNTIGVLGLYSDITETREAQEIIKKQANYDLITGLPNRRMILDRLEQMILHSERKSTRIALLLLDLDHFKEVNDSLGHDKGDILLKKVGERVQNIIRNSDTAARLGGDEFVIILPDISQTSAVERIAQKIISELSTPFQIDDDQMIISTSIGITIFPEDGVLVSQLLKNADQAMYQAKQSGRNQFQYFTPEMQAAALHRTHLINALRGAITNQEFELHYQPIVDLNTNQCFKAEALIRWVRPEMGIVSPADFIPLSEETRQIIEIGDWVVKQAAKQVSIWQKTISPDFQISVNTSPIQYEHNEFFLSDEFLRSHIPNSNSICIEITESLLMQSSDQVTEKLLSLREYGMDVSLDDFGTGYSSLAYLNKFSIDYLKIDRSFVSGITENKDHRILCEAIIDMAHRLNIKVVAEGIETDEQRIILKNAGCDYGQGYYFSKPVSAEKFSNLSISF